MGNQPNPNQSAPQPLPQPQGATPPYPPQVPPPPYPQPQPPTPSYPTQNANPPPPPHPYPYGNSPWVKPKKPYPTEKGDGLFIGICALLGFLCIRFVLMAGANAAAGVYTILFTGAGLLWFWMKGIKMRTAHILWTVVLPASGLFFILYGDSPLKYWVLLLDAAVSVWWMADGMGSTIQGKIGRYAVLDEIDALFSIPFAHFGSLFGVTGEIIRNRARNKNALFALIGVTVALPILLVMGSVLSSADAAFALIWDRFFELFWDELPTVIGQMCLAVPAVLYLYGMFYGNRHHRSFAKRTEEKGNTIARSMHCLPLPLVLGVVIPVVLLYLCFFIAQSAYFLSAFSGDLPDGFYAAEYARRGFFELCFVSGFNLALWALLRVFSKGYQAPATRPVCLSLSAVTLGMVAIALRKMVMYIGSFGLTPLRVYTTIFMVFIALVFFAVSLRCFRPDFPLEPTVVAAAMILLLGLAFSNPGRWIARYNVWAYQAGRLETIDVQAMYGLGASAVPGLIGILQNEGIDAEYRGEAACYLWQYQKVNSGKNWKFSTLEELHALRLIRESDAQMQALLPEESELERRFDWF